MAKVLIGSDLGGYTFNKVAQTITFSGFTASLERVLMVTDTTNNTIIYQFNDATKGGTLTSNVLTLTYNTNTVAFNNTDKLQIFYWSEEPQDVSDNVVELLINKLAANQILPDTIGRARVILEGTNNINTVSAVATVSTVTTVSTVSTLTSIGIYNASLHIPYTVQIPIEVQMQKIVIT